jgi:hypothetical protein
VTKTTKEKQSEKQIFDLCFVNKRAVCGLTYNAVSIHITWLLTNEELQRTLKEPIMA